MKQIAIDQNLIMLDGMPLALITRAGLAQWKSEGLAYSCRYDQITDESDNNGKYRCLYEKEGSHQTFLLVTSPSSPEGFSVVLFDRPPPTIH